MTARRFANLMDTKAHAKDKFAKRVSSILKQAKGSNDPEKWYGHAEQALTDYLVDIRCKDVVTIYKNIVRLIDKEANNDR